MTGRIEVRGGEAGYKQALAHHQDFARENFSDHDAGVSANSHI